MTPFIHLRLHSAYSLAEGAVRLKPLASLCKKNNMPAVAVTDTVNLFGAMEFALSASENGIQPIIGALVDLRHALSVEGRPEYLVLLVQNEEGYQNLLKIISQSHLSSVKNFLPSIELETLKKYHAGLLCLTGGPSGPIGQMLLATKNKEAESLFIELKNLFPSRFYMEIQRHDTAEEDRIEQAFIDMAFAHEIPLVATNDVHFPDKEMFEAHDALLCIAQGSYVGQTNRRHLTPEHYFKSSEEMRDVFKDLPEAYDNTFLIAQRCAYMPRPQNPILPKFPTVSGKSENEELRLQAKEGLEKRLKDEVYKLHPKDQHESISKHYFERLEYELNIIEKMGFPGYFLIVSDFIKWAKKQEIPVGPGRGSGAGSLVAWSVMITDMDPIRFNLIFERFLNPERVSMPDFDIDFCQARRDEVIHYVGEKYGIDHIAHIITFGKLQARAVLRDVGRVLQIPYGQVDKISKLVPNNPSNPVTLEQALELEPALAQQRKSDPTVAKLIDIGLKLEGLYRHASTHAAGVVIGNKPLDEIVPLYKDDKSHLPATQFSMKYVEMAGLVKFDFLGLKTLTVIEDCCKRLRKRGIPMDISKIPLDDPATFKLLCNVDAVGVFQVESGGMRDVLRKLQPDRFEDLIALVALYRPGPMDDIPRYLACKHGQESVVFLHPLLKPILEATYGVMVYQEQVMQIAQVLGGYTLGAADLLRRAMGKKIKSEMDAQQSIFTKGAIKNGISPEIASQIFEQMAKFAGYGFNKSHSAPYALIAYQTAYLKANYPLEFYAASMSVELNNTDKLNFFRQDMEQHNLKMLPPDINASVVDFNVEGDSIRYALAALKNVGEQAMTSVIEERSKNGPFQSLTDFFLRSDPKVLNKRQMENLIASGAFDLLEKNRAQIWGNMEGLVKYAQSQREEKVSNQASLFSIFDDSSSTPKKDYPLVPMPEWPMLEKLQKEFDALGFFFSSHPLAIYQSTLKFFNCVSSANLLNEKDGKSVKVAGVLLTKQEKTSKTGQKYAFIRCSDQSGVFEAALFSDVLSKNRDKLISGSALLIEGILRHEGDGYRLTAQHIQGINQVAQHMTTRIRIYVNELQVTVNFGKQLDAALKKGGEGTTQIIVELDLDQSPDVEVFLPHTYNITPEVRVALHDLLGVTRIEDQSD